MNLSDGHSETPLGLALWTEQFDVARRLLDNGAAMEGKRGGEGVELALVSQSIVYTEQENAWQWSLGATTHSTPGLVPRPHRDSLIPHGLATNAKSVCLTTSHTDFAFRNF